MPYPTVFYYQDIKTIDIEFALSGLTLNEDIYLISTDKNIYKNDQGCRKVEKNEIINLIKNDVF